MHEYSLVSALLDSVEAEARARNAAAVERIVVRIGELAGVEIDLFETAYQMARQRTICARASLEISVSPARWGCTDCDRALDEGSVLRCPDCGSPASLLAGDEIILETIEMELG